MSDEVFSSPLKTVTTSILIIHENNKVFLTILTLTTLPLSLLTFSLLEMTSSRRLHIFNLETHIAHLTSTPLESTHVHNESHDDAVSLLHLKAIFFIPTYILSLIAVISTVKSTSSAFTRITSSFQWDACKRTLLTSMYGYAILTVYAHMVFVLAGLVGKVAILRFLVLVVGLAFEVYVMGVVSVGLVVSVVEDRFGWGAIRVGFRLMDGRRVFGWVLSGGFAGLTGWVGWCMERVMDGNNGGFGGLVRDWRVVGLVGFYAVVVVFGFVVVTVFYCEGRRVISPRGSFVGKDDDDDDHHETEMMRDCSSSDFCNIETERSI